MKVKKKQEKPKLFLLPGSEVWDARRLAKLFTAITRKEPTNAETAECQAMLDAAKKANSKPTEIG